MKISPQLLRNSDWTGNAHFPVVHVFFSIVVKVEAVLARLSDRCAVVKIMYMMLPVVKLSYLITSRCETKLSGAMTQMNESMKCSAKLIRKNARLFSVLVLWNYNFHLDLELLKKVVFMRMQFL